MTGGRVGLSGSAAGPAGDSKGVGIIGQGYRQPTPQPPQRHFSPTAMPDFDPPPLRLRLASSSRYRRELLERLRVPFEVLAPDVDETPQPGEPPARLAARLALAKAQAVAARGVWTLGSDQVATLDGRPIGKPGNHAAATAQLLAASGRTMLFHTAVALVDLDGGRTRVDCVDTAVRFRHLGEAEIEAYLLAEQPYDCAGAAKSEGLGIALLDAIEGPDPTALIGLPLILLAGWLRDWGWNPLLPAGAR